MNDDPLAPKLGPDTLGKIMGDVRRRDAIKRHSAPVSTPKNEPNKFCDYCSKVWYEEQILSGPDMMPKTCQDCLKQLAEGGIAIIAPNNAISWVWGAGAVGLPQKNRVSQAEYDLIVKHALENQKPEGNQPE